ncbi:MAG TPA: hypothetical protein VGJ92_04200 [Methanocella sp.]|jgi:hypothetical protein
MLRKILLATLLLAFFVVAPALAAPDTTYYTQPLVLNDDSGLKIEINSVVASDLPHGSLFNTFPPDQFRYYTVYFTKYNPTDHDIRYQFNISFVDSNGTVYTTEDNILATGIGPGIRVADEPKEFPVARNATGLYIRWYHLNTYLNSYEWTNIALLTETPPTPTPTPAPTVKPTPTSAATPTATAKPTPADGFLPVLAIGLVASGFILARARK